MKLSYFSILCMLFLNLSTSFAQDQKQEELIKSTADGICTCVNTYTKGMDDDVKDVLIKIFEFQKKDDREGVMAFFQTIDADLQTRMQTQMMTFEKNKDEFENCMNEENKALKGKVEEEAGIEKKMQAEIVEYLSKKENCQFAATLINMGSNQ